MIRTLIRPFNYLAHVKFRGYISRERQKNPDLFYKIDRILNDFHSSGGLKWDGQDFKLFHLWKICEAKRPNSIIEFGSGSSTALICEYIKTTNCTLTTIDESEAWLENTKKLCGSRKLGNVIWRFAARRENISENLPTCWYEHETKDIFDFAIVDGPSLNRDPAIRSKQVCVDALQLKFPPRNASIAIDGRISTYRHLARRLGNTWTGKPTTNNFFASTLLKRNYRSYSLLQR